MVFRQCTEEWCVTLCKALPPRKMLTFLNWRPRSWTNFIPLAQLSTWFLASLIWGLFLAYHSSFLASVWSHSRPEGPWNIMVLLESSVSGNIFTHPSLQDTKFLPLELHRSSIYSIVLFKGNWHLTSWGCCENSSWTLGAAGIVSIVRPKRCSWISDNSKFQNEHLCFWILQQV